MFQYWRTVCVSGDVAVHVTVFNFYERTDGGDAFYHRTKLLIVFDDGIYSVRFDVRVTSCIGGINADGISKSALDEESAARSDSNYLFSGGVDYSAGRSFSDYGSGSDVASI